MEERSEHFVRGAAEIELTHDCGFLGQGARTLVLRLSWGFVTEGLVFLQRCIRLVVDRIRGQVLRMELG